MHCMSTSTKLCCVIFHHTKFFALPTQPIAFAVLPLLRPLQRGMRSLMAHSPLKDLASCSVMDQWRQIAPKHSAVADLLESLAAADTAAALWMLRACCYRHYLALQADSSKAQVCASGLGRSKGGGDSALGIKLLLDGYLQRFDKGTALCQASLAGHSTLDEVRPAVHEQNLCPIACHTRTLCLLFAPSAGCHQGVCRPPDQAVAGPGSSTGRQARCLPAPAPGG